MQRALALELSPVDRARASFTLARALWDADQDRPRARQLAEQALETLQTPGPAAESEAASVRAWLAERSG